MRRRLRKVTVNPKSFETLNEKSNVQKVNNVPATRYDKKLDYIVTDKYIL